MIWSEISSGEQETVGMRIGREKTFLQLKWSTMSKRTRKNSKKTLGGKEHNFSASKD